MKNKLLTATTDLLTQAGEKIIAPTIQVQGSLDQLTSDKNRVRVVLILAVKEVICSLLWCTPATLIGLGYFFKYWP